ncbi:3-phosphoshikimate 1-carboxyvinyltransferase [Cellulomonas sp. APG4]|uniref:3-phosphoshikimate 1-carboxyvinyltransferase n=1 Tax=Cellulomonas sp. APG4 TaxID=1538656 RepID=UPI00137A52DF|nr:3-phosphoshikimate 1-carboxyvinyltransferase [Cellulomonas sp. APG4]NCT91381.1 3-phosphoshikimate 1-carboxyvinyltransferase [Cellulomonas sp. APG4]
MSAPSPTAPTAWRAPAASGELDATVEVPGSKSLTNRYLVLAALADGPGTLHGALDSRDTRLMSAALDALGARVNADGASWRVEPLVPGPDGGPLQVDCGLAGTVMRFLPPVAALLERPVRFDGDPQARVRPMGPVLLALRELGAQVDDGGRGTLPFTVTGGPAVRGGAVDVDASSSSQFVSGLLLTGAALPDGLLLRHTGRTLPSLPHIRMTVDVLRAAGVAVDDSRPDLWHVAPGRPAARDVRVEPDLSNAAPFLCAALVAGGTVRVPGWPSATTQPGGVLPELLRRMGATSADVHDGVLTVTGDGTVRGVDVDLGAVGELTPTIAALAALGDSPSRLRGVGHIRGHETDRLAALATELGRVGTQVEQTHDGLVITPRPLRPARMETYHDHRMATAAALVGLRVPGVEVVDVETTAKTLPDFAGMWTAMLGLDPADHPAPTGAGQA